MPLPAPVRPAPLLLAPVPFCLLALSFLPVPSYPSLPAPAPAACACCRSRACPRLFAVRWSPACPFLRQSVPVSPSLRRLVAVTHVITPSASRQAHRPKPPGPPSVSVRLAPPSSVLSGFRRLVSPRSRTCPSLHFPACPCSRFRTCAFLRQSALSAPSRPGPCAPGPFLRTRASENHRGE